MRLVDFARAHGVLIDSLIEDGRWHRVPTEDHPRKRNGAYRSMGDYAHIQDHANHDEPILWQPDATELAKVDRAGIERRVAEAQAKIRRDQQAAARKAAEILSKCTITTHPYLAAKGFPEERGNVFTDRDGAMMRREPGANYLCIPMRVDGRLVGLQTISDQPAHERKDKDGELVPVPAFEKRFLFGQQTMGTVYMIDNKGPLVFCEGYATGLSVRAALQAMKVRYRLAICFTAGNMAQIAGNHKAGMIVADYDKPSKQHPGIGGHGRAVALAAGLPFWLSDREGEDFNDFHIRRGLFGAMSSLRPIYMQGMKT